MGILHLQRYDEHVMTLPLIAELENAFGYPGAQVDYLCNIGKTRAFLYFETPKVACSSIKRTLQLLEPSPDGSPPDDVHDKDRSTLNGALSSGLSYPQIFISAQLFRFTFVRNPYSRILSCFLEKIIADESERRRHQHWLGYEQQGPVSFLEFLQAIARIKESDRDIHWRSQAALINDRNIHYHFIGRFEHLDRDFRYVLAQIGIENDHVFLQNVTRHKTHAGSKLRDFFGPAETMIAQQVYRDDFLRYGYSLDLPER